jgi:formylglycine-generating enzyme required for sulfatase activity
MKRIYLFILMLLFIVGIMRANNVLVGTPLLIEQNSINHYVNVQFDLSWDNSWRTSSTPNNWDGVWLFVKYKRSSDSTWHHATLNTTASNHSTGSQGAGATINSPSDGKGVFFYRSSDGTGTFISTNIKLRWDYGTDNLGDTLNSLITEYKVFAIEMVYVPDGSFYVGSGGSENFHFYTYGGNNPYHLTSEDAIFVGQSNGYLYYLPDINAGDGVGPIPASFPKGYNSFWCMKYEITQEQYSDFLNTLTASQQSTRNPNNFNLLRFYIKQLNGIYGCDGNNNNILNEADDGQNIACNYLGWADGCAYADWSGMRPMTELEFEKACRGTITPVANEYSWGSTNITAPTGITNQLQDNEMPINSTANCNFNGVGGPMRVGCFTGGTRGSSGASYYGIMELSGNLWEYLVTVGNVTGRNFTGLLGDGILDAIGNANVTNWPGTNTIGSGFRGGRYGGDTLAVRERVSDRIGAARSDITRIETVGFRCVRSAE